MTRTEARSALAKKLSPPQTKARRGRGVNIIDLFAGAGGLSVGASLAGGKVVASVEIDPIACQTLRANPRYHGVVLETDICAISGLDLRAASGIGKREPLIVVGGPPCQPFSKAAYWTEDGDDAAYRRARASGVRMKRPPAPTQVRPDARRDLVREFMRVVVESRADGFVFENVPSLKHPRNVPIYDCLVAEAQRAGYHLTSLVANAAEYGVAQLRQRVLVLGSRAREPANPKATHRLPGSSPSRLPIAVTAAEALDGLDVPELHEPEELICGRWAKHLSEVPPGGNYKAHTAWAGHPKPTFVTETRFWNFLLKLAPDRPSWTIAASPGPWTGPFHWQNRRLRIPELAALQGFPRGYVIEGSRRERVRQMGNAVSVPLAKAMIRSVLSSLG